MLEGKVVLVTGAARGIGCGSAMLFAREGAQVVVADISAEGVAETAGSIVSSGGEAIAVGVDITKSADVSAMLTATLKAFGRLDCAFNNAGMNAKLAGVGGKLSGRMDGRGFRQAHSG